MSTRTATSRRETGETKIEITLDLDGRGRAQVNTGVGFLDHMLTALARHARFDLAVQATGDLHVDEHHTVEDVGIALGRALGEALGDRAGITRMGHAIVPMDEALALVAVDIGGRGYFVFEGSFDTPRIGQMGTSLVPHFFESLALEARMNLHARLIPPHLLIGGKMEGAGQADGDDHHRAEALFKALARALHQATRLDPTLAGDVPSTKGTIDT
jgi:imidazoleglycerol-phosphate dehydratase